MIVSCPSCATKFEMPVEQGAEATVMRCGSCGHGWIEAHATKVSDLVPVYPQGSQPDAGEDDDAEARIIAEARKIARAAQIAEHKARTAGQRRSAQIRGWTGLAAGICLVLGAVVAMPERIVQAAPAAAKLYSFAGKQVNVYGLNISSIQQQYMIINDQPVLALRGRIANITDQDRRVPPLRFVLRNADGKQLHTWTLNSVGRGPIGAGVVSSFVTRLAAPPQGVESVEIRFARPGEIG
ncbi:MAG: zinc-ribbon domain-containing protein [Anderseniella sp.]